MVERSDDVIVAVDSSEGSTAAAIWAATEAHSRGCDLTIVHVCPAVICGRWTPRRVVEAQLRRIYRPMVASARAVALSSQPTLNIRTQILLGSPAPVLVSLSRRAQLLVVGWTGTGSLGEWLLGSVPQRLMANAACPVVAVNQTAKPDRVVVAIDEPSRHRAVLDFATEIAARQHVAMRVIRSESEHPRVTDRDELERGLADWQHRFPHLRISAEIHSGPLADVLARCAPQDLLVLGRHRHRPLTPHTVGIHTRDVLAVVRCPLAVVADVDTAALVEPALTT